MHCLFSSIRWIVLTVGLTGFAGPNQAAELSAEKIYAQALPSVLTLQIENQAGERYVGSAFLALQGGVAVTAWHVVSDAVRVTAKFSDGVTCDVTGFLDCDETKDLALLQVDSGQRPMLQLSRSKPAVGARTYVIGSPKGYEFSIGDGLLSQVQKVDGFDQYQVTCPFSPGNSGGPILNSQGTVLGVAAWTRNGAQNVNFATPAYEAFNLSGQKPLTPWKELRSRKKPPLSSLNTQKRSSPDQDSRQSARALKELLQKSAGKEVTVIVVQEGQQEKFTFTVPPGFGK